MHGSLEPSRPHADGRIRVLLLLANWIGGGAERVAAHLVNRLDPEQFDTRLGLLNANGPYLDEIPASQVIVAPQADRFGSYGKPNRELFSVRTLVGGAINAPRAFRHMVNEVQPDVVMSFLKGTAVLTWLALMGNSPRPRWIAREGNNVLAVADQESPNDLVKSLSLGLTRRAYRRADRVLCNSTDMATGLVGDLSLDPAGIRMINNPIDIAGIQSTCHAPFPGAPARPYILSAGRLEYQKAHEVLIRAYAQSGIWRSHTLVILGKGSRLGELHRLAATLGVGEYVRFIGFVANPYAWMARAELIVQPSRWEGFPTVAAEAQACGTPLLLTDCAFGTRDIVQHGVNGELVPVDDVPALAAAMARLIGDPALRARLAAAAQEHVKRFNIDAMVASYADLFSEWAPQRVAA